MRSGANAQGRSVTSKVVALFDAFEAGDTELQTGTTHPPLLISADRQFDTLLDLKAG